MKDEQREWFEYEMTIMFNIDREKHLVIASKDRTNLFIDKDPFIITQSIWEEIKKWNLFKTNLSSSPFNKALFVDTPWIFVASIGISNPSGFII